MSQPAISECVANVSPPGASDTEGVYRVGTLVYTFRALVVVFAWMLFGDFCFSVMEAVVPSLLPLTLKDFKASNATIGLLVGTIPALLNMIVTPILGYRSDRHRGRLGRRIPYLLWPTPVVTVCLICVGYSADIGQWLHRILLARTGISQAQSVLITVGACSVLFQFFNMFIASVYYCLFNDVVPERLMGRFYALFRVVGSGAGFVFNRYVLGMAEAHMRGVYVVVGIVYLVSFLLMCWQVREGEYPPPEVKANAGLRVALATYLSECFSLGYYWWFYLAYALLQVGGVCFITFRILFARQLGMSLDETGKILSWGAIIGVVLYFPLGWLADKIHPLRLYIIGIVVLLGASVAGICCVRGPQSFWLVTMLWFVGWTCNAASNAPLFPAMLPKNQFGQFCSSTSLVAAGLVMLGNYFSGMFIDRLGNYSAIYWWGVVLSAGSLVCAWRLYQSWLRYGGDIAYVAPLRIPTQAVHTSGNSTIPDSTLL